MRKDLTLAAAWAACMVTGATLAQGQQAEEIPRLTEEHMNHTWYTTQVGLWKAEVDRDPTDAHAWFNYFKASRYAGFGDTTAHHIKVQRMTALIDDMERAIPNSWEYHFIKWWNGGNDASLFPHLEKAYSIKQDYGEMASDFIAHYELEGNKEKMKFFCEKWYETQRLSPALFSYNYNVLTALDKNAILITAGDNDTYPIWILQYVKGIRPDVTVINAGLIGKSTYRDRIMKEQGLGGDATLLDKELHPLQSRAECMAAFLKSVAENTHDRPIYVGLTVDTEYLDLIKDDLYIVGLAHRYSRKRLDNIAILKKNWERLHLDYLDLTIYGESYRFNKGSLARINMNYITPALVLYEHHSLAGEAEKAAWFREFALRLARAGDQEEGVLEYLTLIDSGGIEEITRPSQQSSAVDAETESEFSRSISLSPNPARTSLTVRIPDGLDAEIEMADMQGKVLRKLRSSASEARIDVENLPAGAYILRIVGDRETASKTVHVAH